MLVSVLAGSNASFAADQTFLAEGTTTIEKLRRDQQRLITAGTQHERLMRGFDASWAK